jgi:hypothetical protein
MDRILRLSRPAIAVLLVLIEVTALFLVGIIWLVSALGLATTLANLRSPDKTIEKGLVLGLFSQPWLPEVIVFFTIALTIFLCWRLAIGTRPPQAQPLAQRKETEASPTVNPRESYFSRQTIRLVDLVQNGGYTIEGKTFEDCLILGPAIIAGPNNIIADSSFDAEDPDVIYIVMDPQVVHAGWILLSMCVFRRCEFRLIGIVGPQYGRDAFAKAFTHHKGTGQ